jgi:hypothetical protein
MTIEATAEDTTETMGTDAAATDDATEASPAEVALSANAQEPKVVTIPTQAMARIKQAEREKGKKLAHQELNARAKAHGFDSWEALEATVAVREQAQASASPPIAKKPKQVQQVSEDEELSSSSDQGRQPPKQSLPIQDASSDRQDLQRALEVALEEKRQLNQQRAAEAKIRKSLEKQLDAVQAENTLRLAAAKAGVQDVDYALHLLRIKLTNKSEEDLSKFDENTFFSTELRASHPYLYGVEVRPASTATATEAAPSPAKTRQVEAAKQENDARKLSREEFDARLRKLGLSPPVIGMIS